MRKIMLGLIMMAMTAIPAVAAECGAGGTGAVSMLYGTGKTGVTSAHKKQLADFIDIAKTKDAVCIFAQVDAQGSEAANKRVADARAKNMKSYLVSRGIKADRILIAKESESFTFFGLLEADQEGERKVTVSYSD